MRAFLILVSLGLALSENPIPEAPAVRQSDLGHWEVGDCLLAQFAMQVTVHPNTTAANETMVVDIPADANVDADQKNCGNETQNLSLTWMEIAKNDSSVQLKRSLEISFSRAANSTMYGVDKVFGVFDIAKFKNASGDVIGSSAVEMIWRASKEMMFMTPLDRSFLCANINTVDVKTSIKYDVNPAPLKLNDTQVTAEHVQFDAFRPAHQVPSGFRTPMDCDFQPNDIIPIAVGVALAALVVAVLVAYMIGRRRNRQRGYQSV